MKSSITTYYRKNNTERVLQGDILKDISIPIFKDSLEMVDVEYCAVLSQDCDLNQDYNAQKAYREQDFDGNSMNNPSLNGKIIPSILLCPAYPAEQLRTGTHLQHLNIPMNQISKPKQTLWRKIEQNEIPRYHHLEGMEIFESDLVLDFKRYYCVSRDYFYSIYPKHYFISLNELYREDLSLRFSNYQSRIGLP